MRGFEPPKKKRKISIKWAYIAVAIVLSVLFIVGGEFAFIYLTVVSGASKFTTGHDANPMASAIVIIIMIVIFLAAIAAADAISRKIFRIK